jgi:hypothetical protein
MKNGICMSLECHELTINHIKWKHVYPKCESVQYSNVVERFNDGFLFLSYYCEKWSNFMLLVSQESEKSKISEDVSHEFCCYVII